MCLNIKQTFKTRKAARAFKPLITKRSRLVYKVGRSYGATGFISPHRYFKYTIGETVKIRSFGKEIINSWSNYEIDITKINITKGFHAWRSLKIAKRCRLNDEYNVYKCIIPAGTPYYLGDDGDIVSLAIRPVGVAYRARVKS